MNSYVIESVYPLTSMDFLLVDHYRNPCHPSYYHWPICVDNPDGYGCECGPGFYWNMHMCVGK